MGRARNRTQNLRPTQTQLRNAVARHDAGRVSGHDFQRSAEYWADVLFTVTTIVATNAIRILSLRKAEKMNKKAIIARHSDDEVPDIPSMGEGFFTDAACSSPRDSGCGTRREMRKQPSMRKKSNWRI